MSDDVSSRGLAFAKFLSGVSPEVRERVNALNRNEAKEQHKVFHEKFQAGQCSFCGEALTAFDPAQPCRQRNGNRGWSKLPQLQCHERGRLLQYAWPALRRWRKD